MPSTKMDEARERMNSLRASQKHALEAVRDNRNLSGRGRLRELARVHREHRIAASQLREQYKTTDDQRRLELQQRVFGIPAGVAAADYRDAAARVADMRGADQLQKVIDGARRSGDAVLERAAAAHAHQLGHRDLVDSYAERAGHSVELDELRDMPSAQENSLGVAALFSVGTPEELRDLFGATSDGALDRLINEPDTADVG